MKLKTALIASMVLASGTAAAAEDGFYAGAGVGYGKINVNEDKITNNINGFVNPYYDVTKDSVSQGSSPYSLTVGYQFMKYFAVELSYIDLGNANYRASLDCIDVTCSVDAPVGTAKVQWEAQGWPISALGQWPVTENWSVFGRVGVFIGDVKATAKLVNASDGGGLVCGPVECAREHVSQSSTEFIGGVGTDYTFMDRWTARLEWQAMPSLGNDKTGDGNWNNIQASILYHF